LVWLLAVAVLVGWPALNTIHWFNVVHSGVLPTDADGIGIAILGGFVTAGAMTPIVVGMSGRTVRLTVRFRTAGMVVLAGADGEPGGASLIRPAVSDG
jgi:hypothetical protein